MDNKGFTLIELLTTVAILTILASIAIPMYRGYQRGAARSEATTNLTALALCMDEYYAQEGSFIAGNYAWTQANNYTDPTANNLVSTLNNCFKPKKASGGVTPKYDYAATVTATGYDLAASGRAGTIVSGDTGAGNALTIDEDGAKTGPWPQ